MTTTEPLFAWARTRATDPSTSSRAARSVPASEHVSLILDALERADAALSAERIGDLCGLSSIQVTRRVRDMERAGRIRRDGEGRNRAGRAVTLWRRT